MNKMYIFLAYCMSLFSLYASEIQCLVRTIPPEALNVIMCVRHSFYNGPRNSAEKTAWNVMVNHKECSRWDELDYWYAIHEISQEYVSTSQEDYKNYFHNGYIFCVLESVRMAVIHQYKLYDYPGFWNFLISCPDYQELIFSIYEMIQKDKNIYNQLSSQSYKTLCTEYQKMKMHRDEKKRILSMHESNRPVFIQEEPLLDSSI